MTDLTEVFGEPIHTYTRAQAIADGVLVTLPKNLTEEASFCVPVDMTTAAYADTIRWGAAEDEANPGSGQDETGRAWDVLTMLRLTAARHGAVHWGDRVPVQLVRVPADRPGTESEPVTLHAVFGGDEQSNPTITLLLPHED